MIFVAILLCIAAIVHFGFPDPSGKGKALRNTLETGFQTADKVEVIIHSDRLDFMSPNSASTDLPIEYERIELTDEQKQWFLRNVPSATSRTAIMAGMLKRLCGFRPHHTFSFTKGNSEIARVEVCFLCDSASQGGRSEWIDWQGVEVLREGLALAGIDVERDWVSLAEQNREQDGAGQPATAPELKPESDSKSKPESEGRSQ